MSAFLTAAVLIVAIMAATVAFAIKALAPTPARIVAVLVAITALVAVLPRVFDSLQPQAPPPAFPAGQEQGPAARQQPGAVGPEVW
ncbi:hypothetical protein ACFT5C_13415 [Streptomyces sp. NPDC057116]|uniref:hypothetical protein n=1 Tax=Streptomyces sp. NPDC057116 TaxID=3346023 RepID=UPI0036380A95